MSRLLYFDCFSGISGDMLLGAMIDAGLPLEELRRALGSLAIAPEAIQAERVMRAHLAATKFRVLEPAASNPEPRTRNPEHHHHDHDQAHHDHDHHHDHPHRTLKEIFALIGASALSPAARGKAQALFERLAEAEAAIHQMPLEQVHLHE